MARRSSIDATQDPTVTVANDRQQTQDHARTRGGFIHHSLRPMCGARSSIGAIIAATIEFAKIAAAMPPSFIKRATVGLLLTRPLSYVTNGIMERQKTAYTSTNRANAAYWWWHYAIVEVGSGKS